MSVSGLNPNYKRPLTRCHPGWLPKRSICCWSWLSLFGCFCSFGRKGENGHRKPFVGFEFLTNPPSLMQQIFSFNNQMNQTNKGSIFLRVQIIKLVLIQCFSEEVLARITHRWKKTGLMQILSSVLTWTSSGLSFGVLVVSFTFIYFFFFIFTPAFN